MKYLSTNDFTIATNTPEVRSSISELTQKKGHKKDYTKSTRALNNDTIRYEISENFAFRFKI